MRITAFSEVSSIKGPACWAAAHAAAIALTCPERRPQSQRRAIRSPDHAPSRGHSRPLRRSGAHFAICPPAAATPWLPLCGFHAGSLLASCIDWLMTASISSRGAGCGCASETPISVTIVHRIEAPRFFLSSAILRINVSSASPKRSWRGGGTMGGGVEGREVLRRACSPDGTWTGRPYEAKQEEMRWILAGVICAGCGRVGVRVGG